MSWNRQYRPQTFSQLHLSKVRQALSQLLERPQLPQAYLFSGPKGTGKTSASRILAAILNDPRNADLVTQRFSAAGNAAKKLTPLQEPNTTEDIVQRILSGNSLSVQELDAASNRGIDDIRALKERVHMPPQEGLVSVFILDEAHMLTNEASNALLKVLEEPPKHVVFVLATTEQHKILPTIISRCFTVEFSTATTSELIGAFKSILKLEKITADDQVLELVARRANGSFRDGVKLLETIAANKSSISMDEVDTLGSQQLDDTLYALLNSVVSKQAAEVSQQFIALRSRGMPDSVVHTRLLELLHEQLLIGLGIAAGTANWSSAITQFLLHEYSIVEPAQSSPIPLLALELKSLELIARAQKKHSEPTPPAIEAPATKKKTAPTNQTTSVSATTKEPTVAKQGNGLTLCERWGEFVELVAQANTTLAAFLRSAQPLEGSPGSIAIRVFYSFHKDQLLNSKSQVVLQDMIQRLCGGTLDLQIVVSSPSDTQSDQSEMHSESLPALAASELL